MGNEILCQEYSCFPLILFIKTSAEEVALNENKPNM